MSTKPTFEQAQLHLQVYDQRREARLRQARDWCFKNYHVTTLDDAMRIAPMGSETGAFATDPNPGARHRTGVFRGDRGLDVANQNRASGGGRKMFLTCP
jgi:hypothetical protein